MAESFSKEAAKEFALRRLRITPDTAGKSREDIPSVIRDTAGLQYGGHMIELFNRFQDFRSEWFAYWFRNYSLTEGHVLRGALRIVNTDEYPYYFKATRCVARRRSYHRCPESLTESHFLALGFLRQHGPLTPAEFQERFGCRNPELANFARRLLDDLYNYGEVARMGRRNQKPLYHALEKLPYKLDMSIVTEAEAKKWLCLKALGTYGPFTVEDIAHWIGWNLTETKETLSTLLEEKKITVVSIKGDVKTHYLKVEDVAYLDALEKNLPEHSFIKILFNDDALLLGFYKRLNADFGYDWRYPQLSEGIVWRAAVLYGRDLIGEAIVENYAKSEKFTVKKLILRKNFVTFNILSEVRDEFDRHARFQKKILNVTNAKQLL